MRRGWEGEGGKARSRAGVGGVCAEGEGLVAGGGGVGEGKGLQEMRGRNWGSVLVDGNRIFGRSVGYVVELK